MDQPSRLIAAEITGKIVLALIDKMPGLQPADAAARAKILGEAFTAVHAQVKAAIEI